MNLILAICISLLQKDKLAVWMSSTVDSEGSRTTSVFAHFTVIHLKGIKCSSSLLIST